jgi:hypothetical protein
MKRAKFTEYQIIRILRKNEAGAKAGELARSTACLRARQSLTRTPRFSLSNEDNAQSHRARLHQSRHLSRRFDAVGLFMVSV